MNPTSVAPKPYRGDPCDLIYFPRVAQPRPFAQVHYLGGSFPDLLLLEFPFRRVSPPRCVITAGRAVSRAIER